MGLNTGSPTKVVITAEDKTSAAFASAKKNFLSLASGSGSLIAGLGAVSVAFGAVSLAVSAFNKVVDDLASLDDMAQKTGSAVENLSKMQKVAKQYGADFGAVDTALAKLAKGLNGVDEEGSKVTVALKALGISQEFLKTHDPSEVFVEASKRLQNYRDGAGKTALVTDALGKSAAQLLPYMNDLAENFDRFKGASAESAARAAAFQDALGGVKVQFGEIAERIGVKILPGVAEWSKKLNESIAQHGVLLGLAKSYWDGWEIFFKGTEEDQRLARMKSLTAEIQRQDGILKKGQQSGLSNLAGNNKEKVRQALIGNVVEFNQLARQQQALAAKNASPYVSPNSGKQDLNYKSAEELAKENAERQKLITSYDSLIAKNKDYITEIKNENEFGEKLSSGQKQAADIREFLTKNTNQLTDAQRQKLETDEKTILTQDKLAQSIESTKGRVESLVEWQEKQNAASLAYSASLSTATKILDDEALAVSNQIVSVQEQIDITRLGVRGYEELKTARLNEAASVFEQNVALAEQNGFSEENIQSLKDRAKALRDLAGAQSTLADKKIELDYLNRTKAFAEETWDSISDGLTNSLFRGFENGKTFAENFFDTLKNTAKTTVLKFTTEFILSPIKQSFGGALFGGSSSSNVNKDGWVSNLSSLASLKNAFSPKGSSVVGLASSGASGLASLTGSAGIGTFANGLAVANGSVSAAGAGVAASQLGTSGALSAGTTIGTAMPYIGAAIAIYSLLSGGGLFGSKPTRKSSAVRQTFDGSGNQLTSMIVDGPGKATNAYVAGLTGTNQNFATALTGYLSQMDADITKLSLSSVYGERGGKKGKGRFSGSIDGKGFDLGYQKYESYASYLAAVMGSGLKKAIQKSSLGDGLKSLFDGYSRAAHIKDLMAATIQLNAASEELNDTWGISVDTAAKVARSMGKTTLAFTQNMAEVAFSLKTTGEKIVFNRDVLGDAYTSIAGGTNAPNSLNAFDTALSRIDTTTKAGLQTFYKLFQLRSQFAELDATMTSLKTNVGSAIYSIMTPAQQLASSQSALNTAFGSLNLTVPGSVQELVALGQSIDYTTESGLDLAAAFPSLVEAFNDAQDATDALVGSMQELDINRFKTLVDYRRATSYVTNGISLNQLPSYDVGTPFVNGDQIAQIHHGERILTATDNASLMERLANPSENQQALVNEIRALRQELLNQRSNQQSENIAMLTKTERISKAVEQLNNEGVILRNTDNSNEPVVLDVRVLA